MRHLQTLKTVNTVFAVLSFVGTVAVLVAVLAFGVRAGGPRVGVGEALIMAVVALVTLVLGVFFLLTGRRVAEGRWRVVQTVLAALSLGSVPFGTAYGVYALWVCWMNDETKGAFR